MNTTQKIITNAARYPPSLFHSKDVDEAFDVASKAKFASIMLTTEPDIDILFSPFFNLYQVNKEKVLYAHLFRANPLYEYLKQKKEAQCRILFNETDMYISPNAYDEKKISHRTVPTWNYVAVQFKGVISLSHENNLRELLEKQVEIFESDVKSQWRLSDAPNDYVEGLMKTIFGIKVEVTDWKVHKKLNQTKSEKEYNNTRKWCEQQGKRQLSIVDWMNYFDPYKK